MSPKISVVIPTCNRESHLLRVIEYLEMQSILPMEIIVVDSSDKKLNSMHKLLKNSKIKLLKTEIKSAAIQKNLGIENLNPNTEYVAFIDDDIVFNSQYLSNLLKAINSDLLIGVAGIAYNKGAKVRPRPFGIIGFMKRVSMLDSKRDGKILSSGVAIPVRQLNAGLIKTEWLIGCSFWRYGIVKDLRFEKSFMGNSLGEDVIFSYLASKNGNLAVDTDIFIENLNSPINRPDEFLHYSMWIKNRYKLVQAMNAKTKIKWKYISFHWSNFCNLTYKIFSQPARIKKNLNTFMESYLDLYAK